MSICSFLTGKCLRPSRVGGPSIDLQKDFQQGIYCEAKLSYSTSNLPKLNTDSTLSGGHGLSKIQQKTSYITSLNTSLVIRPTPLIAFSIVHGRGRAAASIYYTECKPKNKN